MNTRLQALEQIGRKYQVKALYVFGSRSAEILQLIRDDNFQINPSQSDVDIGVLTRSLLSIDEKGRLRLSRKAVLLEEKEKVGAPS